MCVLRGGDGLGANLSSSPKTALRAVRLAALRDSPSAFSSTHQAEQAHPAQHWAERARHGSAGDDSATFFATVDDRVVGLVGAYRPNHAQAVVELVSMWTAPDARRTGAGRRFVDAVGEWARAGSADSVELWVTQGNNQPPSCTGLPAFATQATTMRPPPIRARTRYG